MPDDPNLRPMRLIVTNPSNSGRAVTAAMMLRKEDGTFEAAEGDGISLGDGLTTVIEIPFGGRLVLRETKEPPLPAVMATHPVVTGAPAVGDDGRPLNPAMMADDRRLAELERRQGPLTPAEIAEQQRLVEAQRAHPAIGAMSTAAAPVAPGSTPGPTAAAQHLLAEQEAERRRLADIAEQQRLAQLPKP